MKNFFTLFTILFSMTLPTFCQSDESYDDLLELYVDEEYEKLCYKSEKYFLDDKYKKDPMPYLYFSMGQFELSKDESLSEKYPKAIKDAFKFAVKFVKKDKDGEYLEEAEDFFAELRLVGMEEAENQMINEKYTKAKGMYKYLIGMDDNDAGAKIYMAYTAFMMRSAREAEELLDGAIENLNGGVLASLTEEQLSLLKNSIITMSDWPEIGEYRSKVSSIMDMVKDTFSDEKDFNVAYDSFK